MTTRIPSTSASRPPGGLGGEEQSALVDPVGDQPAEGTEEEHREELQTDHDAEVDTTAGQVEDQPGLGHRLHPGARRPR